MDSFYLLLYTYKSFHEKVHSDREVLQQLTRSERRKLNQRSYTNKLNMPVDKSVNNERLPRLTSHLQR